MNPVPDRIRVNTGNQGGVSEIIDSFFCETKGSLEKIYGIHPSRGWEIKSGEVAYSPDGPITDNRITYLTYCERIVAGVFETRDDLNWVLYTFFRNLEGLEDISSRGF